MIYKNRIFQLAGLGLIVLLFGLILANTQPQVAHAASFGITLTPTTAPPDPTDTPVPTATPITPTPVQTNPTVAPTSNPTTESSESPPDPTPTPQFPTEIPELGYGPSIWVSLSILFLILFVAGLISMAVYRRVNS